MIQRNCTIFSDELGSGHYLWQPGGGGGGNKKGLQRK